MTRVFSIARGTRRLAFAGCLPLMLLSAQMSFAEQTTTNNQAPTAGPSSEHSSVLAPQHVHARPGIVLTVFFARNQAELTPASRRSLDAIAPQLRAHLAQGGHALLDSHSDATGVPEYNLDLSEQRAHAVATYLRDAWDIPALRLQLRAWGDRDSRHSDQPHHAENRRVEITLLEGHAATRRGLSLRRSTGGQLDLDDFGNVRNFGNGPTVRIWRRSPLSSN